MRKLVLTVALLGALASASSALAVTYGHPDGDDHPNVGALLATEAYDDGTWAACTGTLISPTVFLTAAHCDLEESRVEVTFETEFDRDTSATYWGTWHPDLMYGPRQNNPHDIAVVVFDEPPSGIEPARLPEADSLANLSEHQKFTSVGYGGNSVTNGPGGKTIHYSDVRYAAVSTLNSTNPSWLRNSMNPVRGDGGGCYGDSGGPNFLGSGSTETDIVAATTITGDAYCRATNVTYRLDTPWVRNFLDEFVSLP